MKSYPVLILFSSIVLAVAATSPASAAQVDPQIPLSMKVPLPAPKTYTFRFSLHDAPEGGIQVWQEEKAIRIRTRTLRHLLGSVTPLDPAEFTKQLWLEVARRRAETFVPVAARRKLVVAPYALWSAGSDSAGPQGPAGPRGPAGVSCWDLDGDGIGTPAEDVNADGNYDALDCRGPQGAAGAAGPAGPQGPVGPQGSTGPRGPAGADGRDGTFCWDLDGDGVRDKEEDVNGDEVYDALDCRGPQGIAGPAGPAGPQGPAGSQGPAGPQGPAGTDGVDGNLGLAGLGCPSGSPVAGFDAAGTMICSDGSPAVGDSDGDGLIDTEETLRGTDPADPDSDDDGLTDGEEVFTYHTYPLVQDSDGDTLTDGDEVHVYGTTPTKWDTDGDSANRRVKVPASCIIACTTYDVWVNTGDAAELNVHGTDPTNRDTDGDGLDDGLEIALAEDYSIMVDPLVYDSDGDSVPDSVVKFPPGCGGPWPLPACVVLKGAGVDTNDGYEFWEQLNPANPDTDGDGVQDGQELFDGTDPRDPLSF